MEGIGLDNMLGADEVRKLFSEEPSNEEPEEAQETKEQEAPEEVKNNTAEVDFSDLIGNQSEGVGSEEESEGNGEAPDSKNDTGAPNKNLFSSCGPCLGVAWRGRCG